MNRSQGAYKQDFKNELLITSGLHKFVLDKIQV